MPQTNLLLGVNIDHVVTLRQARYRAMPDSPNAEPSVLAAALAAEAAGTRTTQRRALEREGERPYESSSARRGRTGEKLLE